MKKGYIWASVTVMLLAFSPQILAQQLDLNDLAEELVRDIPARNDQSIAVVDPQNISRGVSELGRSITEQLTLSLISIINNNAALKGRLKIIDRNHFEQLAKEAGLALQGAIDPSSATKYGKIKGINSLVVGTLTPSGDSIHLTSTIIDTTTGRIWGAAQTDIPKTENVKSLYDKIIIGPGGGSGGYWRYHLDLTPYEIGDIPEEFSQNLLVITKGKRKCLRGISGGTNGSVFLKNLKLKDRFEVVVELYRYAEIVLMGPNDSRITVNAYGHSDFVSFNGIRGEYGKTKIIKIVRQNRLVRVYVDGNYLNSMLIPHKATFNEINITGIDSGECFYALDIK